MGKAFCIQCLFLSKSKCKASLPVRYLIYVRRSGADVSFVSHSGAVLALQGPKAQEDSASQKSQEKSTSGVLLRF